jgi:hypothetical protein
MKLADRTVIVLCEDVRREIGDKVSLIGVFNDEVVLPSVPYIFPKICFHVMLNGINKKILPVNLEVQIFMPQGDPQKMELPFTEPPGGKEFSNANIGIQFSPFMVTCAGETRIEIRIKGQEKPVITHKFFFKTK